MENTPADRLTHREMSLTDLDQVLEIETRAYQFPWSRGIFMDCFRGRNICRVACLDGRVVGHAVLTVAAGEANLLNVCIQRDAQGNGLGRVFMHHLIKLVGKLGAQTMFLEVRPSNKIAIANNNQSVHAISEFDPSPQTIHWVIPRPRTIGCTGRSHEDRILVIHQASVLRRVASLRAHASRTTTAAATTRPTLATFAPAPTGAP